MKNTHRISMTNGNSLDGRTGSKSTLIVKARASGLCVAKAWNDGSVPLYRDVDDARRDVDGSNAIGLIRDVDSAGVS